MNNQVTITIGELPIQVGCASDSFKKMLEQRYGNFVHESQAGSQHQTSIQLDIDLITPSADADPDADLEVRFDEGRWTMRRGDFSAQWDPETMRGSVRQAAYPYALDSVIRIIHSLILAKNGAGFLLHSASAVRNGRAFLFSGVSGAGKTTISRLAPPDAILLTDEISYIRRMDGGYRAFGTPFAGELGSGGEDIAAPIGALYVLRKGTQNRIGPIDPALAARMLLRNILFFANDSNLVERLFRTACDFVAQVPIRELTFRPLAEVWRLIG